MATTQQAKPLFARRGYGYDAYGNCYETTFLADDAADRRVRGWVRGWYEDGAEVEGEPGRPLVHVYEPSWRVSEPQRLTAQAKAAA